MLREFTLLFVLIALASAAGAQAPVLDQSMEPNPANVWKGIGGGVDHAQTFTAGMTGRLTRVDVRIQRYASSGDLFFDVRGTSSGVPIEDDGDTLASVTLPAASVPTSYAWVSVDISFADVTVRTGDVLAIALRTATGGYQWEGQQGNPYPGGEPYFRNPGSGYPTWTIQTEDLGFRTYVVPHNLVIEARDDMPGPVDVLVEAKSRSGGSLGSQTLVWHRDDNGWSARSMSVSEHTAVLRFTFVNDYCGPGCPGDQDADRNAFIDFFTLGNRTIEGEDWDRTDGTDPVYPGCSLETVDSRHVTACGNQNDWVEYDVPAQLPALSPWGGSLLASILLVGGALVVFRRRRTAGAV